MRKVRISICKMLFWLYRKIRIKEAVPKGIVDPSPGYVGNKIDSVLRKLYGDMMFDVQIPYNYEVVKAIDTAVNKHILTREIGTLAYFSKALVGPMYGSSLYKNNWEAYEHMRDTIAHLQYELDQLELSQINEKVYE